MRARLDSLVEALAKGLCFTFFRSIERIGMERIPAGCPLVLVANHHNSLVDPILILGTTGVPARFLAKSTLWDVAGVRQLLELAGSVPVYRRQDGVDTTRNEETFTRCWDVLAAGGAIALFPEGISHDAPHLAPLRTGVARIVLGAARELGVNGTRIVPIGLTFEEKGAFRSRALVTVGEPLDPAPWLAEALRDETSAVRGLTEAIRAALVDVTLNYPSREEVSLIEQAASLWAVGERELPARMALAEAFALRRTALALYERARARNPVRAEALARRVRAYGTRLAERRLRDEHVTARYPHAEVAGYVVGSAALLGFWLPLAALGSALNFIPYHLLRISALRSRSENLPATIKLVGGFFLYPLTWALWAVVAGFALGSGAALATALLAPLSAWFAMLFLERYEHFFEHARAWAQMRLRPGEAARLRRERAALHEEMRSLAREAREPDQSQRP
jgi:1-acyl-sn-glycerol-3-phosphate acyltransferase